MAKSRGTSSVEADGGSDSYALIREDANANRGAGWTVNLRRRGHRLTRIFKDSVYGSPEESWRQARAWRDAVISAIPPVTNHEQALRLRKNNQSGISGVRRVETDNGDGWQATLTTMDGQKRETFSVARFGEEAAKSMAIAQRARWLKGLPVKHLAFAHHAEEVIRQSFPEPLMPAANVLPAPRMSDDELAARLAAINARFDADRPPRLRVRVKRYTAGRLSLFVSDAGQPAQRKLVQINIGDLSPAEIIGALTRKIREIVARLYNDRVAGWFLECHAGQFHEEEAFAMSGGFNVLVFVPAAIVGGC